MNIYKNPEFLFSLLMCLLYSLPCEAQQSPVRAKNDLSGSHSKISDERRSLMDELRVSKNDLLKKDHELSVLKDQSKEILTKSEMISTLSRRLENARALKVKYEKKVAIYRDSLANQYQYITSLENELKKIQSEREGLLNLVQIQANRLSSLEDRIKELEGEKEKKQKRIGELEQILMEFDFFTSIRVYGFTCLGYVDTCLDFSFYLDSDKSPSLDYKNETTVLISVMKKTKLGASGQYMLQSNGKQIQTINMVTGQTQTIHFCTSEKIIRKNDRTDSVIEYIVDVKVVYRNNIIWTSQNTILDLEKCGQ